MVDSFCNRLLANTVHFFDFFDKPNFFFFFFLILSVHLLVPFLPRPNEMAIMLIGNPKLSVGVRGRLVIYLPAMKRRLVPVVTPPFTPGHLGQAPGSPPAASGMGSGWKSLINYSIN